MTWLTSVRASTRAHPTAHSNSVMPKLHMSAGQPYLSRPSQSRGEPDPGDGPLAHAIIVGATESYERTFSADGSNIGRGARREEILNLECRSSKF